MRGSIAGFENNLKNTSPYYYAVLSVLDVFISCGVVAPAVVGYWRGVWMLSELYVFPDNELLSALVSTLVGSLGHLFFALAQNVFIRVFHPDKNRILYFVFSRCYTTCFGIVCVNGWRGPWSLLDYYCSENDVRLVAAIMLGGVLALASMRTLRNVSAPPFAMSMDKVEGYFEVPTLFRNRVGEKTHLYILDCLFSVIVVGTLVVFVWRGVWVLLDILLFPDNPVWSAWSSLVLGYCIAAIAFLLQPIMKWACDKLNTCPRLVVADLFLLGSLIATVNVWRGIWNLLNIYLLPGDTEASCWITHCVCLTFLVLMGCSNSLLVRGVYIDAEEPGGKCVIFPCYYLRVLFQEERQKKLNENLRSVEIRREEDGKTGAEMNNVAGVEVNSKVNHITT